MTNEDIRWQQRFSNFSKALSQLTLFIEKGDELNNFEKHGLIKAFEYTYELAWNVLKDFLEFQGKENVYGSRDAIREAFKIGLIEDGENWMNMFRDRNRTAHTYNEEIADEIAQAILHLYYNLFLLLQKKMEELKLRN